MSFEKKKTNQVKNIFTKDNPKEKREINRKKNIQKEEIERKEQIWKESTGLEGNASPGK